VIGLGVAALVASGGVAYALSRRRTSSSAPAPVSYGPPPPPPGFGNAGDGAASPPGVVDSAVAAYDSIVSQKSYAACMSYVGNKSICEHSDALKYANPVTASVHVAAKVIDYFNPF